MRQSPSLHLLYRKTSSNALSELLGDSYKKGELLQRKNSLHAILVSAEDAEAVWAQLENRRKILRKDIKRKVGENCTK